MRLSDFLRVAVATCVATIGALLWSQFGIAHGADLKVPAYKAPAVAELYDYFNGGYIGGYAGVGWDRGAGTASDPFGSTDFNTAPFGFTGGLYGGVGTHFGGNFYLGIEGDGGIITADGTVNTPGFVGSTLNNKTRWLASLRGRFGFILAPNLMAYGTAGWGWAGSEFTVTGTDGSQFSTNPTLNGAVAGAGLEYALGHNWGLRVQYLHYFLGDLHASTIGQVCSGNACTGPILLGANVTHSIGTATAGLAYKF